MKAAIQKKFKEKIQKKFADSKKKETKINFGNEDDDEKKKSSSDKKEAKTTKPAGGNPFGGDKTVSKTDNEKKSDKDKVKGKENIDPKAAQDEAKAKRFGKPDKIEDPKGTKVKIDFDPILEADLAFIFDNELEDIQEHQEEVQELREELIELGEVLSVAARFRRRAILRRSRNRIRIGRQRALRRRATTQRITQRARRSAISALKRKFAGGRSVNQLSFADRARVERIVSKRPRAVANLTRRNIRVKRQLERQRFQRKSLHNSYEFYMTKFLNEWVDDGSSGGIGSPYQSGNAIANNINYNKELRDVCTELKVSPLELTKMAQTLGKYAHELSASEARSVVTEYRKKYDK